MIICLQFTDLWYCLCVQVLNHLPSGKTMSTPAKQTVFSDNSST